MTALEVPMQQPGGSRIPLALQAVFIASNRGKDVNKPPPEKLASKTYFRGWMFQGFSKKRKERGDASVAVSKSKGGLGSILTKTSNTPPGMVQFGADGSIKPHDNSPELISVHAKPEKTPTRKPKPAGRPPMSPQAYLDVLIHSRGYSTRRYRTLQTGYYAKPTAFQQASYNVYLVKLVRANDVETLRSVIQAGISPNPCNAYGESLVHMVCRRGDHELLKMLLEVGTSIQVSDDYGRTPLHDACWAAEPSFQTVELVAAKDIALFHMTDSRGAVPLSYVRRDHWPLWIEFLESKKDDWWPVRTEEDKPAPLIDVAPNERPVPEPTNALSIELAGMVASGVMSPAEAALLMEEDEEDDDEDSDDDESDDDDEANSRGESEEGSDNDDDSECDDDDDMGGFSADDMANILSRLHHSKQHKQ